MKPKFAFIKVLPSRIVLATTVLLSSSFAAPVTWDNGSGDSLWTTSLNWNPDGVPTDGDDLAFGTAGGTVLLNGNQFANSLGFTSNFTLGAFGAANPLTISSGNLSVNPGFLATINAALTPPSGDITLIGGGTAFLNNPLPNFAGNWIVDGAGTTLLYRPEGPTNQYNGVGSAFEAPRGDQLALGINTLPKTITLTNGGTFRTFGAGLNPDAGFKNFVIGSGGGTMDVASGWVLQSLDDAGQIGFTTEAFTKAGKGRLILTTNAASANPLGGVVNINGGMLSLDSQASQAVGANTYGRFTGIAGTDTTVNINSGGTLLVNNGTAATFDAPLINANNGSIIAFNGQDHNIGYAIAGTTPAAGPTVLKVSGTTTLLARDLFGTQTQRLPRLRAELDGTGTLEIRGSTGAGNTPRLVIERSTAGSDFSGTFRLVENTSLESNPRLNTSAAGGTGAGVDTGKVLAGGDIEFAGWGGTLDMRDSSATTAVFDYTTNEITATTTQAGALNTINLARATTAAGSGHLFNFGTLTMGNHRLAITGNNSYQAGFADASSITGNAVIEMRSDGTPLVFSNAAALTEDAAGRSLAFLKTGHSGSAARDVISGGAISLSNLQVATGTLQLRGANGSITTGFGGAAPVITVNGGALSGNLGSLPSAGLLHLDNNTGHVVGATTVFAAAENTDRIANTATLNMRSNSTLRLTSLNNSGTTETIGTTNVFGHATFDVVKTGTPTLSPVALTFSTLTLGSGATANFTGTGTSLGTAGIDTSRIVIPGTVTGFLGAQYHSGNEWAKYDATGDNGFAIGVTPFVPADYTIDANMTDAGWVSGQQLKLTSATGVTMSANQTVDRINTQLGAANQVVNLSGFVLTVAQGGILSSTQPMGYKDGATPSTPSGTAGITAGTTSSPTNLIVHANATVEFHAPIIDNAAGGAVTFVKSGTGSVILSHQDRAVGQAGLAADPFTTATWSSTNTGGWVINDGTLNVHRGQFLGATPTTVTLNGGQLEINQPVSNANADSILPGWGHHIVVNGNAMIGSDDNGESLDGNTGDRTLVKLGSLAINNGATLGFGTYSAQDIAFMGGATFSGKPTLSVGANTREGVNNANIISGVLAGSGFDVLALSGGSTLVLGGTKTDLTHNTYNGAVTIYGTTVRLNKANGFAALTDGAASEDVVINGGTLAWGPGHHGDLSTTNNFTTTNNNLLGIAPTSPADVLAAGMNQIADTANITLLFGTLGEGDRITNETFGSLIQKNGTFNVGLGSIVVNDATISGGAFNIDRGGSFKAGTLTLLPGAPDLNITTGLPAGAQTTLDIGAGGLSMAGQNIVLGTGSSGNVMGSGGILKLGGNVTHTGTDLIGGSHGRKGIFVQIGSTFRQLGNSKVDLMGGNRTFTIDTDSIFTITAPMTNGGLVKSGGGALVLEPYMASTFAGPITVNEGILQAKGTGAFGTSAGGVTINSGGTVKLDSAWTYGDNFLVSGPGALTPGGLGVREVGALVAESGINRLTGSVAISGNTTLAGNTFLDPSATPGSGGMALRIGTLRIESAGGLTGSGTVTLSGHGDGVIVNGIKTTAGGVNKDGAGRWTIGNASSYVGATVVSAGTLRITHGAALGTTGAGTSVYGGGSLALAGGISVAEPLTLAGDGSNTQSGSIVNLSGVNTLTGPITLLGTTLRSDAGTLNVNTTLTGATGTSLTLSGAGNGTIGGAIKVGAPLTGSALTKNGRGTWTLSGINVINGASTVNGGTLVLNSTGTALHGSSALNMGGGSLTNSGTAQTVNGLNLLAGGGTLSGGAGLSLGAITQTVGATANFAGTVTTTSTNTNGILGGYALFGSNWATVGGGSMLAGYAAYTPIATATATDNATASSATLAAATGVNSLRITGAGLNLAANNLTLASGGILYTGSGNDAIFGTATLSGATDSDELIVHTVGSGILDIAAPIIGLGAGGLTKAGDGTLFLSATNAFTGPININGGTLAVTNPAALGSASSRDINLNGGTLNVLGDYDIVANTFQLNVGPAGGTIGAGFGAQISINDGSASGFTPTQLRGSGDLTFTGGGRYTLSGGDPQFTGYTGNVTVNSGILTVGHQNSLGGRQEQTLTLKSGSAIINNANFALGLNGLPNNIIAEGGVEFFAAGGNRVFDGDIQLSGTNTIALMERDLPAQDRQVFFNGRVSGTGVTLNVFGANNGNPFYLASGSNDLTGTINLNPNATLEVRTPGSLGIDDGDVTVNMATNSRLLLRHFQNADYHTNVVVNGNAEINSDRLATQGGGAQQFLTLNNLTVNGDNTILTVGGGNNYYTRVDGTMTLNGTTNNILNVTASDLLLENGLTFGTPSSTLDKRGGFTAILRQPTNHAGTLIMQGGLIYLQDNGALPTTTAIQLRGGELRVDNSNVALANRINDTAPITFGGGVLRITGAETIGTVTAAPGTTQIVNNAISETVPNPLTLTGFTRQTGAILSVGGIDLGAALGSTVVGQARVSSRILVPGLTDSTGANVLHWAVSANEFVQYSTASDSGATRGLVNINNNAIAGYNNDPAEGTWTNGNINRTTGTTVTDVLTADRTLQAIKMDGGARAANQTGRRIDLGGKKLTIETGGATTSTGGLIIHVANTQAIGNSSATPATLTAGLLNVDSELVLQVNAGVLEIGPTSTNGTALGLTGNVVIADNGTGKVTLVKSGGGTVQLRNAASGPANTYTGGTHINQGTLDVQHIGGLGTATNPVFLNGGILTFNLTSSISGQTLAVPNYPINVNANSQIILDNGAGTTTDHKVPLGPLAINGPYTLGLRSFDGMDATFTGTHTFAGTPTIDMAQVATGGNGTGFFTLNGKITGSGFYVGSSGAVNDTTSILQLGAGETTANDYSGKVTILLGTGSTGSFSEDLRVELNKAAGTTAITGDIEINGGILRNLQADQIADTSKMLINQGSYDAFGKNETFASVTMRGGNFRTSSGAATGSTVTITGDFNAFGADDLTGSPDGVAANSNTTLAIGGTLRLNGYSRGTIGGTASNMIIGGLEMTGTTLFQSGAGSILVLNGDVTTFASSNTARLGATTVVGAQVQLNGTRTFTVADGSAGLDLSVSTSLKDSASPGSLVKTGAGMMQLEGAGTVNDYTGTTAVNEGSLVLFKTSGINAIPAGALTIGDGTGGANADQVIVRLNNQIADTNDVTIASSGLLDLSTFNTSEQIGWLTGTGNVTLGAGSSLTVGGTVSALTTPFSGVIEGGGGSLVKSGTGSQVLGGSNTYSGITTVSGGSLYVNGTHSGGSDYSVAIGSILGGDGTITGNGNVTYADGSTLQVGNPSDTGGGHDLAFNLIGTGTAFTLSSSTTLSLDLWTNLHLAGQLSGADQTQSDVLAVTASTINLAGILNVANPASISSWLAGDTFDLFDWFSTPTGTFNTVSLPTLTAGLSWDTSKLYLSEATDPNLAGTIKVQGTATSTPIETWRQANFGSPANSGNGADGFDPDQDGVPNVMEYALGMDPNVSTQTGLPTYTAVSGSGQISFNRSPAATDVTYVVQASNNLTVWSNLATRTSGSATWTPVAGGVLLTDTAGAVSVTDNVTVAAQPRRFMRVVATNPLP